MIIGLTGYARSGKNTVANILKSKGYKLMAFADPIKQALLALNPTVANMPLQRLIEFYEWDLAKQLYPEVRIMLQRMGTEVGRDLFGKTLWIDIAMYNVKNRYLFEDVVFTDVRFPNEAKEISNRGGQIWKINRKGVGPLNDHYSEISMDSYLVDLVINNDHTLETLEEIVNNAYQTI